MMRSATIAIVGGASSVAKHLLSNGLPNATPFVRSYTGTGARQVARYQDISAADLEGFSGVINCAGAVAGDDAVLEEANVVLPVCLAKACKDAGVPWLVHLSSFSVYGRANAIDSKTGAQPVSAYGRSKLHGDEALLAEGTADFAPVVARFPAILDVQRPNRKVAKLLSAWRRLGAIPVPAGDVRRSMISSRLAARVLTQFAFGNHRGVVLAADPIPFGYALAAKAIREETGHCVRTIPLPSGLLEAVRAIAPDLHATLFRDSLLAVQDNFAAEYDSDLFQALRETVR